VHQFAHVAATLPHAHEPGFCEWPQIIASRDEASLLTQGNQGIDPGRAAGR
jgi:hypothetical protein